jgi:hypothetical protein
MMIPLEKRKNTIVNLDYTNPLDEKTNLELGAESRNLRTIMIMLPAMLL